MLGLEEDGDEVADDEASDVEGSNPEDPDGLNIEEEGDEDLEGSNLNEEGQDGFEGIESIDEESVDGGIDESDGGEGDVETPEVRVACRNALDRRYFGMSGHTFSLVELTGRAALPELRPRV